MFDFNTGRFVLRNMGFMDVVGLRQTNYVVSKFGRKLPNGPRKIKSCVNYGLPNLDYYEVWATENNEDQVFYTKARTTVIIRL